VPHELANQADPVGAPPVSDGGVVLDRWFTDSDLRLRRSAMLALLIPLRQDRGGFQRFGRHADAMLEERDFFIRKAVGWMLRDTGRKRPDVVCEWLLPGAPPARFTSLPNLRRTYQRANATALARRARSEPALIGALNRLAPPRRAPTSRGRTGVRVP
jgi:hypothetical protein